MADIKTAIEPSIKNRQAMNIAKKIGRRYTLLDAMLMGRRLGINWKKEKFTVGDLLVGMHYELEHGKVDPETNVTDDNPKKTAKIAWTHLKERPDYYVQLMKIDPPKKLEKKAEEVQQLSAIGDLDSMYKKASLGDRVRGFSNKNKKSDELSDEERSRNQAMAAMAIPAGVGTVAKSRHQLLGQKRLYHGTTAENAKSIKRSGLKTSYGAKKGGIADLFYRGSDGDMNIPVNNSRGHVYASTRKNVAIVNANVASSGEEFVKDFKKYGPKWASAKHNGGGKKLEQGASVVKMNVPLNRYKKDFEKDPEYAFVFKNPARRSGKDIPVEEIVGSKAKLKDKIKYQAKNMPDAIKADKKRFAKGVAKTVGGTALTAAGIAAGTKLIKDYRARKKKQLEQNNEKTAMDSLDELFKQAAYLKDISCEECGYKGKPDNDGTCPKCNAIGGHKAMGLQKKHERTLKEVEEDLGNTADDAAREEQESLQSMAYGG